MNNSDKNKIFIGISWSYAERILAQLVSFVVSIILARLIAPENFGMIAIVMVFISICDALTIGGFGNALIQKKDADEDDFSSICWLSLGIGIILYLFLFIAAPVMKEFYKMDDLDLVIRIMGFRVIVSAYNSVQQAYIQKKMEFKKFFFATLGGTITSAVIGMVMAYSGFGIWALVTQYMTNSLIDTFVLFLVIDWKPKFLFSVSSIKSMSEYGIKMLLSTLTFTVKDSIRSLIIGKTYSSSDLAFYNQGQKYPNLIMSDIVESIGKVLFPFLSEKQDDKESIKKYMRKSICLSAFFLCPILIGLIVVADTFVYALLTEKWEGCIIYIRILSIIYLFRPMDTVFQKGLLAIGKININLAHELITSIITIFMILISVIYFDSIPLIAWSYVFVTVIGSCFFGFFTKKYFHYLYSEMMKDYMPSMAISVCMGICVYFFGGLIKGTWLKLILQVLLGGIVYVILAILFKLEALRTIAELVRKKIRRVY